MIVMNPGGPLCPSPLCPLCNIHTHDTHHLFNCTHIRTTLSPPGFVDKPRRSDCTAGQMDGEAGWWTTSGNIGLPPLARAMGVGRQQQQQSRWTPKLFGHCTRGSCESSRSIVGWVLAWCVSGVNNVTTDFGA